jgi:hypothetical protein
MCSSRPRSGSCRRPNPYKATYLYVADSEGDQQPVDADHLLPDAGNVHRRGRLRLHLYTFHYNAGVYRRIKHFSGYNVAAGMEEA